VTFSATVTDFPIMYSPQELGCNSSAVTRATGFMNDAFVATNTAAAFWLSDASVYEYLIRINTATDNGRAWISIPTFTDVEFWVAVTDTVRGQYFEYHSPAGNRTLIYDPTFFVYP